MCFIAILCTQYSCGHIERQESVKVECNAKTCALSAAHLRAHHECDRSCRQR
ncbi:hypothetical protein K525DRAFT_215139 [Schizophyllum commune Loenen D]|nr:hypothetical protein K525DRAFT_215139 [Schizophyllum commune Loenen D]